MKLADTYQKSLLYGAKEYKKAFCSWSFGCSVLGMTARGARYEKLAAIASGGMATVHLGRATGIGGFERFVAIKEMHPHIASEHEFVKMFLDEARLAARIHHPNVVATLDVTEEEGALALVMEFVEGPTLQQILRYASKNNVRIPLDVELRILVDMLAGLNAAHELKDADGNFLNLVHRDVSPQNILVGSEGTTKITDFGVARAESRLSSTRTGSVKGKVPYMSPEQIRSKPIDRRTDIYAAGVVFWEMLTSKRLVQADSEVGMIYQVTERATVSPRQAREDVPEPIARVCERALAKHPEDRFATAADFAEAVEDAAKESGISIASSRAVSAYVRGLALHRVPSEMAGETRRKSISPKAEPDVVSQPGSTRAQTAVTSDAAPEILPKKPAFRSAIILVATAAVCAMGGFVWLSRNKGAAPSEPALGSDAPNIEKTAEKPAIVEAPSPVLSAAQPSASQPSHAMSAASEPKPTTTSQSPALPTNGGAKKGPTTKYRPREL